MSSAMPTSAVLIGRTLTTLCQLAIVCCVSLGSINPLVAQNISADAEQTASEPAVLIADSVYTTPDRTLVAEGNVEALQNGYRIRAERIVYDDGTGQMRIDGPVRIDQDDGEIIILADGAQMDRDLQEGLITGARLVFSQQIQMAALRMNRTEGRFTQLFKTAVTSCNVCDDGRPPLWQIRARRVIHDDVEKQIFLEDAQFRIRDVPVFYLPRLRIPDPTVERANGFLIPTIRATTELGTGFKLPYFITLGAHRDLTLEPYISPQTRTLGYRYRQAFTRGRINFQGAFTDDDLLPGKLRWYLFGEGVFNLRNDWDLDFQIESTSDNAYLSNYGISETDRLQSEIGLQRISRTEAARFVATYYESLRDQEVSETEFPNAFANGRYARRFQPALIGGEISLTLEGNTYDTSSGSDVQGRDVSRGTTDVAWYTHHISSSGLRHDIRVGLAADLFRINNDSNFEEYQQRITPRAAYRISMPMARRTQTGATHMLEPVVQLGWTKTIGDEMPVDESRFVEFDQGDLLSLSRFPAPDLREDSATFVYGVNWARTAADGIEAWASVAQVLRATEDPNFSKSSGLTGIVSDLLLVGQFKITDQLWLGGRSLLNADFSPSKTELIGSLRYDRGGFDAAYTFLEKDPDESRDVDTNELYFDGDYELTENWSTQAGIRYSLQDALPREAGIQFSYAMECVELDFSVSRRYTSNDNLEPSTSFGFSVSLAGFTGPRQKRQAHKCIR